MIVCFNRKLWIWSHLLIKSLMEDSFCAVDLLLLKGRQLSHNWLKQHPDTPGDQKPPFSKILEGTGKRSLVLH